MWLSQRAWVVLVPFIRKRQLGRLVWTWSQWSFKSYKTINITIFLQELLPFWSWNYAFILILFWSWNYAVISNETSLHASLAFASGSALGCVLGRVCCACLGHVLELRSSLWKKCSGVESVCSKLWLPALVSQRVQSSLLLFHMICFGLSLLMEPSAWP